MVDPVLPDYDGACLNQVVPALLNHGGSPPPWLPEPVIGAEQIVLMTLDGLGWEQLQERPHLAPTLTAMIGQPMTTVVPSTTATALTSLTTGTAPAQHGIVGYRVKVGPREVLNVLRWRTEAGDARVSVPPDEFQTHEPFGGLRPPVVTRAQLTETGFTDAHLAGVRMHGWRVPSTLPVIVGSLLEQGEPFVYAYYDGIDNVAHEWGFGKAYDAELRAADRLVADVIANLPAGAALVIASDHGQVQVGQRVESIRPEVTELASMMSGEGRFRWLHARPGAHDRLVETARRCHEHHAWVMARDEAETAGWFGGALSRQAAERLGDVLIAAAEPIAFLDPEDPGEVRMQCRHGSLTAAEMRVPLIAARP